MLEDIRLNEFPHSSGVYWIIWNGSVIYIGSSKDLYQRLCVHKSCIKKGSNSNGLKQGFYLFLQNNPFSVEYELTENYREKEQEWLDYYEPIYNERKSYTGLTEKEDYITQYDKQYRSQKCNYNGEILNLTTLAARFKKQGASHPYLEAKKYLVNNELNQPDLPLWKEGKHECK